MNILSPILNYTDMTHEPPSPQDSESALARDEGAETSGPQLALAAFFFTVAMIFVTAVGAFVRLCRAAKTFTAALASGLFRPANLTAEMSTAFSLSTQPGENAPKQISRIDPLNHSPCFSPSPPLGVRGVRPSEVHGEGRGEG